jgi:putative oxidoreductase
MTMTIKILHWLCRLILAGVFIYSGYVKVQEPLQFAVAISGYKMVPENLAFPMARLLPWAEIVLGLAILVGWKIRYFSAATAALLLFFISVLVITIARGIEANCGCFGLDERISPLTILRDSLFLIPAIYLTFEPKLTKRWRERAPSA